MFSKLTVLILPISVISILFCPIPTRAAVGDVMTLFDLGTLGGNESNALAVNNHNQVVGWAMDENENPIAFIWSEDEGMVALGTLGGSWSIAWDINDDGVVVGESAIQPDGFQHAFRWQNGIMEDLGVPDDYVESGAKGINSSGKIVGWVDKDWGLTDRLASIFEDDEIIILDNLNGIRAQAEAIKDEINPKFEPTIVGWAFDSIYDMQAISWSHFGLAVLPNYGHDDNYAMDINNGNWTVGMAEITIMNDRAILWHPSGDEFTDLGTLGGSESAAYAINEEMEIVGWSYDPGEEKKAFVYDDVHGMRDLSELSLAQSPIEPMHAFDINDNSTIVGTGIVGGDQHAFLAIPAMPELILSRPIPGRAGWVNTVQVSGAVPGSEVTFVWGRNEGSSHIPGCPGRRLDIRRPITIGSSVANDYGVAAVTFYVRPKMSGKTMLLQAYEGETCRVSNLIQHTF